MKLQEADIFMDAFREEKARNLVMQMMITHFSEAILEHHPKSSSLNRERIHQQNEQLCKSIFEEVGNMDGKPHYLSNLLGQLSRTCDPQAEIWFDEFNQAYENYKHKGKLKHKVQALIPFFKGESYCDIGCGGGDLLAYIKKELPYLKDYAGIDVLDWRTEDLKHEINFQMLDFSMPGSVSRVKYDMATCMAVVHHVGSTDESLLLFLKNIRSAINKNGRLIIEEDVILPADEINSIDDYKMQAEQRAREQPYFAEYLALDRKEQKSVLTIIDLLANTLVVGVQDMAFPFGFRSTNQWKELFLKSGFEIEQVRINGFTRPLFNRSSHVLFILTTH